VNVHVPAALWSYTRNASTVELAGASVREAVAELERRFPGIRHRVIDEQDRIRQHIKFFVNADQVRTIDTPVKERDDITIVCALSGG
jgi:molybdopterin synthase sulfur carrier subunit